MRVELCICWYCKDLYGIYNARNDQHEEKIWHIDKDVDFSTDWIISTLQ
jgi:hypothetical protein